MELETWNLELETLISSIAGHHVRAQLVPRMFSREQEDSKLKAKN